MKNKTGKRNSLGGRRWDHSTCSWSRSCESLTGLPLSRVYPPDLEYSLTIFPRTYNSLQPFHCEKVTDAQVFSL